MSSSGENTVCRYLATNHHVLSLNLIYHCGFGEQYFYSIAFGFDSPETELEEDLLLDYVSLVYCASLILVLASSERLTRCLSANLRVNLPQF